MNTDALLQQLLHDEGFKTTVYRDSRGHLTIGAGHLVQSADHLGPHASITAQRAHALLAADIGKAIAACERLWPHFHALPEEAQQVLTNVAFTLGEAKMRRLTALVRAIEQAQWEAAARALTRYRWYHQVGERGKRLVARLRALGGQP